MIPRLIPVWLELLRISEGLRTVSRELDSCECLPTVHRLKVTLVSLEGTLVLAERYTYSLFFSTPGISIITVCSCRGPQSLLRIGYLVSAPIRPTYAFDVQMLDFMRLLHQRTAPNKSAWSASLEVYLKARGHTIRGKDVIRRKLTTSLRWFIYLLAETEHTIRKAITNPSSTTMDDDADEFWHDVDIGDGLEGLDYLAWRCPLCFGDPRVIGKFMCVPLAYPRFLS